jgi:aspartate kinase
MKLVMKFGGTSVASLDRIRHAASLVESAARTHSVIVVVSAMDGVTEQLIDLSSAAGRGDEERCRELLASLRTHHLAAAAPLGVADAVSQMLDRLSTLVGGILAVGECTPRTADAVVAFGERLSTLMLGAALKAETFDGAAAGIVTNDRFGEADPLMELSMFQIRQRLMPLVEGRRVGVVSGFIAATQHGVTTTLGRGGSDYTATLLGAGIGADEIWIWSDVDGLMTADPRLVPEARLLDRLTFAEAIEMGKFGAKSMHPRALEPAAAYAITVRMKNTFRPDGPGTRIGPSDPAHDSPRPVRSVPILRSMAMITVGGGGMIGRPGTAAAIFTALAEARINVHMICQSVSEAAISVVVSRAQVERARTALTRAVIAEAGPGTAGGSTPGLHLDVLDNIAIVAAVGEGMHGTPGVAARVFGAVARENINVTAIAQGSSERSIAFAVSHEAGPRAVAALHREFNLSEGSS